MQTRKYGILAMVVGAAFLGACEKKTTEVIVEPPPTVITLNIAPDPVPVLDVGQTFQLVSVVAGSATQTAN